MGSVIVPIVPRTRRAAAAVLFLGAAVLGPMLWMLFNMIYFDDPLMFAYGIGSAQSNSTGKAFGTASRLWESVARYFIDVAYNLNPGVLWFGVAGFGCALFFLRRQNWRSTLVVVAAAATVFGFYVYIVWREGEPRRPFALLMLLPLLLPDPVPPESHEPMDEQFTRNLFY